VLNQPYWWTVVGTDSLKIEVDLNNVREITYAVRAAPERVTVSGMVLMNTLTVNCVMREVFRRNAWKKAVPADMIICKQT
jgi:hypothetical protein